MGYQKYIPKSEDSWNQKFVRFESVGLVGERTRPSWLLVRSLGLVGCKL